MIFRRQLHDPNRMLLTGMAVLLAASLLNFSLRWTEGSLETVAYASMGLLYGISFTLLLLSARRKSRMRSGTEGGCR